MCFEKNDLLSQKIHFSIYLFSPYICEVAPVALARYLLSAVPFALLMPVDLLAMASAPNVFRQSPHDEIAARFAKAGKVTILATQMTWVLGNMDDCHPVEIFSNTLRTPAPVTGFVYYEQTDARGNTGAVLPDEELDDESVLA